MNSIDKFIAYQLSYKNRKRHNINAKLDYLINQVNTLFGIIKEEIMRIYRVCKKVILYLNLNVLL